MIPWKRKDIPMFFLDVFSTFLARICQQRPRALRLSLLAVAVALATSSTGSALERRTKSVDLDRDVWARGSSCSVAYYNLCTGWIWSWDGWFPDDRFGTVFQNCGGAGATLESSWIFAENAASCYGFAGMIGVYDVDQNNCPVGLPLAEQPFCPNSGWNVHSWNISVGGEFAIQVRMVDGTGTDAAFASDHPAIGPTGPIPCGTCYPTSRTPRSFYWGDATTVRCPGDPLFDGFCNAQLLMDVEMSVPLGVESTSWAGLKALYR